MRISLACYLIWMLAFVSGCRPSAGAEKQAEDLVAARAVVRIPLASSLDAEGATLKFARASEATCFDINSNRVNIVPPGAPRFVPAPKKTWGAGSGLLLECGAENLLLDSSFEGDLALWTFKGKIEKRLGAGVHGEYGLAVAGPATIVYKAMELPTRPPCEVYALTIYVRRLDAAAMDKNDVKWAAVPEGSKTSDAKPFLLERLGSGPWYRLCAPIHSRISGNVIISLQFREGEYIADAAQLEYEWGRRGGPSSYIPTGATAAKRADEELTCDAQALFPKQAWSCSLWTYAFPNITDNGLMTILSKEKQQIQILRKGIYYGGRKILADTVSNEGWLFITVTYDGKKMDLYHDGISNHTLKGPFALDIQSAAFESVKWAGNNDGPMGLISDFATWDRALSPDEVLALYRTGEPKAAGVTAPKPETGIPVTFKTSKSGSVSVNIFDAEKRLVYQPAVGQQLPAGEHTLYWDGCDTTGRPVPVGAYTVKGLISNLRSVWDGKVGNTSPSPGDERLQYRTGHYSDVIAMPDGGLITCSFWGEHSQIIQYIDGKEDYPVRWSSPWDTAWFDYLVAGAVGGKYLYTVRSHNDKGKWHQYLVRWNLENGRVAGGTNNVVLNKPHELTGPREYGLPGYNDNPSNPAPFSAVCGLAYHAGKLYIPLLLENRIAIYDTETLKEISSFECPAPRRLALDKQGAIFVTSGPQVLRFEPDGTKRTALITGLDTPWGITVGPDNRIYTTELGDTQQVKVFDKEGKLVRVFGQKGGHQGGRVSPDLLEMPLAVSVNDQGQVFIADFGGQRVLALNPDFTLRKIIHGRMPDALLSVSELDRSLLYSSFSGKAKHLWEYKINYEDRTSELTRRWNLPRFNPDLLKMMPTMGIYFRKWNGRIFGIQAGFVFEMMGDKLLPRVKLGEGWVWRDRNADGIAQKDEYEYGDWPLLQPWKGNYVDQDGNMYVPNTRKKPYGIMKVPFQGLDTNGVPKYTLAAAQWVLNLADEDQDLGNDGQLYDVVPVTYMEDQGGNIYVSDGGRSDLWWALPNRNLSIRKYARDGKLLWKAGQRQAGAIHKPGDMRWCCLESGLVDDRYLFYVDYEGPINCWDTDGLWVGRLFSDLPEEFKNEGETFNGTVFRHSNGKVYAYSGPDCTYRISRIVVEGLEDIERFEGRVEVRALAAPREKKEQGLPPWSILRSRCKIDMDGDIGGAEWGTATDLQAPVDLVHDDKHAARCWAQWDDEAVYVAWQIKDPTPAVNQSHGGAVRWAGDQVEFMVRAEPGVRTDSKPGKHAATEYQMEIGTDGDGRSDVYVILNGTQKKGKFLPGVAVGLKVMEDKSGYTMEARIPWKSLGDYRPQKGDEILWNMRILWGTPEGGGVAYTSQWAPGQHVSPQTWGVAVFK